MIEQMYPGTSLYSLGGTIRARERIDLDILHKALLLFIKQNEAVRLRITLCEDEPRQYIAPFNGEERLPFVDFSKHTHPEQDFHEWVEQEAHTPFQLLDAPLYAFTLFKITDEDMGYLIRCHHIICDGYSLSLMTARIWEAFKQILTGKPIITEPESYLNYLEQEREYLASPRRNKDREFWLSRFQNLPEDLSGMSGTDLLGKRKNYDIDFRRSKKIKEFIKQKKISLNTLITALLLIYISRISRNRDHVIGIPVLNRTSKEQKRMIGVFTSAMPLRIHVDTSFPVQALLDNIQLEMSACLRHQKYPYDLLAQDLELRRQRLSTLYTLCVNYYNTGHANWVDDIRVENQEFYNGYQVYDLQVIVREWLDNDTITLSFDYRTAIYREKEIDRIYRLFLRIIDQVIDAPLLIVQEIKLLLPSEEHRLLVEYNKTEALYPQKSVVALFEEQVGRIPDKTAIHFHAESITYDQLNRRANGIASYLGNVLGRQESLVAITGRHKPELIAGILGILKAGAAYLPLDPTSPGERIGRILKEAGARILLTSGGESFPCPEGCRRILLDDDGIAGEIEKNPAVSIDLNSLAYVIYTSGSTGKPKGVMIEHHSLVNYLWWAKKQYVKRDDEVFAFYSSVAFDLTVTSIFVPLISGAAIAVYDPLEDEEYPLYRMLEEGKVTVVKLTPSHLSLFRNKDLSSSSIRRFIVGGEDFKTSLAQDITRQSQGAIELYNEYGPTEATVGCMIHRYAEEQDKGTSVPIGIPIHNTKLYVLDEGLQLLPEGEQGELYISGDGLARGYHNDAAITDKHFIHSPYASGKRMYKTGDLAQLNDNGLLDYIGRIDDQMKIRGFRVELGEITRKLLERKEIAEAVVVPKEVRGTPMLCAYVVKAMGMDIEEPLLKEYLKQSLPHYMIPAFFVFLEALPLTANGKVNKQLLPPPDGEKKKKTIVSAGEREMLLIETMRHVFGVNDITLSDDFYKLGGDSIKAIQIASHVNDKGWKLAVNSILECPIFSDMAEHMAPKEKIVIDQAPCSGDIPLTPIITWFLDQNLTDPHYYSQSILLELKQGISTFALEQALTHVFHHHDSLRINMDLKKRRLFYNNAYLNRHIVLPEIDLGVFSETQKQELLREECIKIKRSFHLEETPLFGGAVFLFDNERKYLFLTAHHLVIDGVSWRILVDDLVNSLAQFDLRQSLRLPQKTHSYQSWAREISNVHRTVIPRKHECMNEMDRKVTTLKMATADENERFARSVTSQILPSDVVQNLFSRANEPYNTTSHELLLIALALTLFECNTQSEVCIEVEYHGRTLPENGKIDLSRTVGWFTSLYPLALKAESADMNIFIKSLKEQIRSVPPSHGIWKYLSDESKARFRPAVRFNYLGDFTGLFNNPCFSLSDIDHGPDSNNENRLSCLLEINIMKLDEKLTLSFGYNRLSSQYDFIKQVIEHYMENIASVINFCCSKANMEFTPSDFEAATITQKDLDSLFTR